MDGWKGGGVEDRGPGRTGDVKVGGEMLGRREEGRGGGKESAKGEDAEKVIKAAVSYTKTTR